MRRVSLQALRCETPEKHDRKKRLFEIGIETLQGLGWTVSRVKGLGKSSVRRITKKGEKKLVSIRTSQDQWIAFPRLPEDGGGGWLTLDDVDVVLAVSIDSNTPPGDALVHWLPADEMRERFDRAWKARKEANRVQPESRGMWIPLYERENESNNVSYVGGGAGLDHPAIARVPLNGGGVGLPPVPPAANGLARYDDSDGLTIAVAKRGLAKSYGVPETSIKIIIEA